MKSTLLKAFILGLGLTFLSTTAAFASTEDTKPIESNEAVILMAPASEPVKAPDANTSSETVTGQGEEPVYKVPTDADFGEGVMHITSVEATSGPADEVVSSDIANSGIEVNNESTAIQPRVEGDNIRTLTATTDNDGTPEGVYTMTATTAKADKTESTSSNLPMQMLYALGTVAILALASFTLRSRIVAGKKQ